MNAKKKMDKKTIQMVVGLAALGGLSYLVVKSAKPAVAQTTVPAGTTGGTPTGGTPTGGTTTSGYVFPGFTIGPDLTTYLAGANASLSPVYGFTRIGLDQPVFVLKGTGFTLL